MTISNSPSRADAINAESGGFRRGAKLEGSPTALSSVKMDELVRK